MTNQTLTLSALAVGFVMLAFARPVDIRSPNLEPVRNGKPRPPVMVPESATNLLSQGCKVTASSTPLLGELSLVTDGDKEHDDPILGLPAGTQWVQIDLGREQEIFAVWIWHWYEYACVYHDVICQISSDPEFIDNVTTVFNNDHDNTSGLGAGADKEYIETNEGRSFAVNGVKARYLRFYSRNNTETATNCYTEIEIYGRPSAAVPSKNEVKVPLRVQYPKPIFT